MANKSSPNGHTEMTAPQQPALPMMGGFGPHLSPQIMANVAEKFATIMVNRQIALMNPRNPIQIATELLRFCDNPEFAKAAVYNKPVGDKTLQGLSARFAEAAFPVMRNLSATQTQISDDELRQTWRVSVDDLETNVSFTREVLVTKRVERKFLKQGQSYISERLNSYGDKVYLVEATDDETDTRRAAFCSKVQRNLMLQHIPPDVKAQCLRACLATQARKDAEDPDAAIKKVVNSFFEIGVTADDLKQYLGHSVRGITDSELIELRAVYTAIQDEEALWVDFLADREGERAAKGKSGVAAAKQKVQELRKNEGRNKRGAAPAQGGTKASAAAPTAEASPSPASAATGAAADKEPEKPAEPRRRAARRRQGDPDLTGDTQPADAESSANPADDTSTVIE